MKYASIRVRRSLLTAIALAGVGCAADPQYKNDGGPTGGTGGGPTGGAGGGGVPPGPTGLPVPPGAGNVPRPSGPPGNLKVLDWAGFKSAITYTFDDAQPSQVEHYADLQATGVRHTFYVTSSSSGFDATFTQAVKDGHEMGNHTVHHCHVDLTGCSNTAGAPASVDAELDDCNSYITSHLGQSAVWTAASPFGDSGWDTPDMSRFFLNRGVASGTVSPNDNTDPFNLPCHAAVEGETAAMFNAVIDDAEARNRWAIFLVHTISPTSQNWYAPIDISVITDSVAHAKSLGDVWIDSMVNVGAYWRAQKMLSAVTPTASSGRQTWTWKLPDHFPPGRLLRVTVDGGTLSQNGTPLTWDPHGYYEVALDAGSLTLTSPVAPPAGVVALGVRWLGRVDTTSDPTHPRFSWSGSGFAARFDGTSLSAALSLTGSAAIFKTVVDGTPQAPFTANAGMTTLMLASGLAAGVHTVELYRQTEGPQGDARLISLTVGDGTLMDPPAGASRLIEFIGDSITCGYGVLGALADSDCFPTESHWDTYAAITGRALGAEVSTIAASGRGIIRNYGGDTSGTMPMLYPRAVANVAGSPWDFHVEPQAVVINLGTNDISNNKGDPGDAFRDTYRTLLETVRFYYPHTVIVCIIAPLLNGGDLTTIARHVQDAVDARRAAGDTNVEFFDQIPAQTADKYACQYHPNVAENMMMADLLVGELKAKLGW